MDLSDIFQAGMTREEVFHVGDEQTAIHVGSGSSRVLATPWMIAFMERVSHRLLAEKLPPGASSVGIHIDVRHLAPTPVGSQVKIKAAIRSVDGERVAFIVEAEDSTEVIGKGEHERMVIDEARFFKRVAAKRASQAWEMPPTDKQR